MKSAQEQNMRELIKAVLATVFVLRAVLVNVDRILMERGVSLVRPGILGALAINVLTVASMANVQVQELRKVTENVSVIRGILVQIVESVLGDM